MSARYLIAAATLLAASPAVAQVSPGRLSADVKTLASDAFEGRAPGTPGETKTIDWLIAQFKAMKAQPGGPNGSWTQPVPLVHTRMGSGTVRAGDIALVQGRDVYLSTVRGVDRVAIANAPMVFVGYGVTAPERGWDDFKGLDLKGKVAVFLVNDPDFEAVAGYDAKGKFGDRRMTYYGRWTYKYEEAARRGAVGALIVHDTPGAGYGWNTVTAPAGENYDIVRKDPESRVLLQGWLEGGAATRLFAASGLDLAALRKAARRSDFRPVALNRAFTTDLPVKHDTAVSQNVLAKLPGTKHADEVVMFGAHWDAYGIGAPDAQGRTIRPGANDDGLGVAGVLELARNFAKAPRTDRSLVFALWSGEERGLLGSETYAVNPVYPAAKTVANLTLDILQTAGPAKDVMLVGAGQNSLEDMLGDAAKAQDRVVTPEALPERGLFYRADHFSVARRGVPTLLLMAISGAPDLVTGGRTAGQAWLDGYMKCYHQTCDAWGADWDLRGAAQDVDLFQTIGTKLASSRLWPEWRDGSEFKSVRGETAGERK
ncbi:Zn-dependent M28 family amino/carboxypeptidase [Sphingomonas sp. PP-F2F-A104-K0414]|uniref:M28 family metallopeptidase n=1 Tax=Sphingomonas sp. PP-F2F-A104-K0414 TaxID=2135661 RepID=UPI001049639E|nr:M28 family metallopeptidase [Sphingomonas sp. PP-F2F-A104-K0414]TCQ01176.1 Zn-dependent M28 family amino/carboxypeptidase [Sphingomonas sp. PP-F2F-A104-K0414]